MGEGPGHLDGAADVQHAALNVIGALRPVQVTAVGVRSRWLALAAAYRAPETEVLLGAMNGPADRAGLLTDVALAAQSALLSYAGRLGDLARWPSTTAAERAALKQAHMAAQWDCAEALRAIPRPPHADHRSSPAHPVCRAWTPPATNGSGPLGRLFEQWAGLAPPEADDLTSRSLYAFSILGLAGETRASWMITAEHAAFRPRGAHGRYVPVSSLSAAQRLRAGAGSVSTREGLTRAQQLGTFTPGGTFEAKGHRKAVRAQWTASASRWGRANTAVTVASSGWTAWQSNAGHTTERRIGRTATQAAAVTGGTIAGGQAGALVGSAVGTAILPGGGTVVGATLGALVGGFAGSELGGWVGDQMVDVGGATGELIGDSLGRAGGHGRDVGGDVLEAATWWD